MKIKILPKWFHHNLVSPILFVIVFLLFFTIILSISYTEIQNQRSENIHDLLEQSSKQIESKLKSNIDFINILAKERVNNKLPEELFQKRLNQYLSLHPEFMNITWVDADFIIKTVAPLKGNSHIIGLPIKLQEPYQASLLAKKLRKPVFTKPFQAIQGISSLEVWVPVYDKNIFLGFFTGVYSCNAILKDCLSGNRDSNISISLIDNKAHLFTKYPSSFSVTGSIKASKPLNFMQNGLVIRVEKDSENIFSLTTIILIVMIVILVLGFSYSLFKISIENRLRKKTQGILKMREEILKKQNKEYVALNQNYKIQNKKLSEANKRIQESQRIINQVSNNLTNGMFYQVVLLNGTDRKFTFLSETVNKFYGCTAEEAIADANLIYSKTHPDDIERLLIEERKASKKKSKFNIVIRVINPDGSLRWSSLTSKPRIHNGLTYWDGVELDITNIKNTENELKIAKEKAEESDRLKSAFLANMSHEIRTPMNGIMGFTELLKKDNLSNDDRKEYLKIIQKSGTRLLNIINDIVDISKIEAGQMDALLTTTNVNEQTEYLYLFFQQETKKKELQLSLKNGLPLKEASIITDKEKVYAILVNLVKNAIKFTDKGGIEFGYEKKGNNLEFFVKDSGIGIAKERQSAVFERFIQANITDKMARQGTGLGLSIAKAYVEMLGGKIWVESEPEKGSVFYFTLPCNTETVKNNFLENNLKPSPANYQSKNLKILVAEDDEISRKLILMVLKSFGKEILTAKNGVEAVELARENPDIDLILMDMQMPLMDGFTAVSKIREFNKNIIILAQTAFALQGDKDKTIASGCDDYISKPIKKDELSRLINMYF